MWPFALLSAPQRRVNRAPSRCFLPRVEALEDRCCPSGGTLQWSDPLDPTFGNGGTVLSNFGSSSQALTDVKVLSDGELLTAGYENGDFVAAEYNADGTFDTSFGSGGLATVNFNGGLDRATGVAIQPNSGGKIMLAGTASNKYDVFGVVRLNPNGTLDTTFGPKGSGGKVTVAPVARVANEVYSMAVLSDGRFLLAGLSKNLGSNGSGSIVLARFNANGTLDTTFGNKGTVVSSVAVTDASSSAQHAVRVTLDSSGRIIVAGTSPLPSTTSNDFRVARFTASGSLDTTFGAAHTGVVTTDLDSGSQDHAYALALQGDGKILVGGVAIPATGPSLAAVVRYNPDGSLDTTFNQDGIALAVWDAGPGHIGAPTVRDVVVEPDGALLIAADAERFTPDGSGGYVSDDGTSLLMRLKADGTADPSFGPAGFGVAATSLGFHALDAAMALQADGRVVVVGQMNTDAPSATNPNPYLEYFALTRFTAASASPSPVQIGSFVASSATATAGSPVTVTAGGITTTNAGATITQVAFYVIDSSGIEQLLGYGTANTGGTWTLTFTVNLASGSYTLMAMAVDSTGAVSDPFTLSLNVL
jgi:uncharacterized delta-60 repeat protein